MINEPQKMKLLACYGRVSTSTQENEGTIETQLSAVKDFADKNNYTIVKQYLDNGWSGDSLIRPALDELRVDARKGLWEGVIIYDPDRLARRYSYQELVMDELREAGIEVIFVTTPAPKNEEDKILYGVKGLFAQYERTKIAERFRLGKLRKAKEGHIITTEGLYGYNFITRTAERQGYLEINEHEAEIVKNIFSWVGNEGLTLRGVVRRLQEQSIKPRKSKRGVWNTSTLSTILRNKTYIGEAHFGASYAVVPVNPIKKDGYKKIKKTSRKIRPEEEWITIPCQKIIERDLFNRAVQRLKTNFEQSSRNTKNEYLLAGKIWCMCGKRRAGEGPQHGKHLYYRCNDRTYSFPLPPTCTEIGSIQARIADKLVWQKVSELMSSPDLLLKQAERWLSKKRIQVSEIDVESLKKQVQKLSDQEDRYTKAYGAGVLSITQLKENISPLREKITILEGQISKAQLDKDHVNQAGLPKRDEIESFATMAYKALQGLDFRVKKAIIKNIIDRVVGNKQELQVYGFIPVTANTNVSFITSDWNRRSPKRRQVDAF